MMAAPGVVVDAASEIIAALKNPATTVIDARSLEELQQDGYYHCDTCRWVNAPSTKATEAPLLELAAENILPDKLAPVVIYCASGMRATKAKQVLESKGYTNVMNAGGLADLLAL